MRDLDKEPYTKDELRVAKWFADIGIGGGDDPIGALIASHEGMSAKLLTARMEIIRLTKIANA